MTLTHKVQLPLIVLVYLILGVATSLIVPLNEAPDEADHFLYIKYLLQQQKLPIMSPVMAENETMEANQPPLFYLLNAAVLTPFDVSAPSHGELNACYSFHPADPGRQTFYRHPPAEQFPYQSTALAFHLARLVSVLLGACTIFFTYKLASELTQNPTISHLAAAVVAFNPQFIFMNASVNNDVLMGSLGVAMVWLAVRVVRRPVQKQVLGLALLVAAGALTKFALFAFWPLAFLAVLHPQLELLWLYWHSQKSHSPAGLRALFHPALLNNVLLLLLLPLLVAGWVYWRNWQLYGDPLVWAVHLQAKGSEVLRTSPLTSADLRDFASLHFRSFWGLFGWMNVQLPAGLYGGYGLLMVAGGAGLLAQLRQFSFRALLSPAVYGWLLTFLAVLAVYTSLFRYILTINWSGYQGRLAFAAVGPLAVLLAAGLAHWLAEKYVRGVMALLAGAAVFAVAIILPQAYPRPAVYDPAGGFAQTCARYDTGLMVEGFNAPTSWVAEQPHEITLWGYGLTAGQHQPLTVQLLGPAGQLWAEETHTLSWSAGQVVSATAVLTPPAVLDPSQIFVAVHMGASTAQTANGRVLERPFVLAEQALRPEPPLLLPLSATPTTLVFGEQLHLAGYELYPAGEQTRVLLYWQVVAPLPVAYTTFVHLLDESGQLVAQNDGRPLNGQYPTYLWQVGELVREEKLLPAAGYDQLVVGVYQLETGQTLLLPDGSGRGILGR